MDFSDAPDRVIDLIKKLHEWSTTREDSAELDAVKARLSFILEKYDLKLDDIVGEEHEKTLYEFSWGLAGEASLLIQIVGYVTNNPRVSYHRYNNKRVYQFELTFVEFIDVSTAYDHYRVLYLRERERLMRSIKFLDSAFFSKHGIFAETKSEGGSTLTDEEIRRIRNIMNGMEDTDFVPPSKHHKLLSD